VDAEPQVAFMFQTLLVRRDFFGAVGPLDRGMSSCANIDWISRARLHGLRSRTVPVVVLRRRVHATNLGRTAADKKQVLVRAMRSHLQRHREAGAEPIHPDAAERA
jgi:hypothetical protein